MTFVLGAVLQKNPVELSEHVRGKRDLPGVGKDLLHHIGVARDLLLVPRRERLVLEPPE